MNYKHISNRSRNCIKPTAATLRGPAVLRNNHPPLSFFLKTHYSTRKNQNIMTFSTDSTFPSGIEFSYVPIDLSQVSGDDALACSRPIGLSLDKLLEKNAGGNVLFVSVPGAFTPTCTENHIPPYLNNLASLKKDKKITTLVILSANDAFVINAWGKLLLKGAQLGPVDELPTVIFASDPNAKFSQDNGISVDLTGMGLGVRTARYAFVVNADTKKVSYFGAESGSGVTVSGLEAIQAAKL